MSVIFVFSPGDSFLLIQTMFFLAEWMQKNRDSRVVFYLPTLDKYKFFSEKIEEIRWLHKDFAVENLPQADVIISTNLKLLKKVSGLNRGQLFYLSPDGRGNNISSKIKVLNFERLNPPLPPKFPLSEEKEEIKRNKILIGGGSLDSGKIQKLISALETVVPSLFNPEVVILNPREEKELNTILDYKYSKVPEIDLIPLLEEGFYLLYLDEGGYPFLSLWAMAAGVIVFHVSLTGNLRGYPLEMEDFNQMDLMLQLIKYYKLGQNRKRYHQEVNNFIKDYYYSRAIPQWINIIEEGLEEKEDSEYIEKQATDLRNPVEQKDDTLVDIVIVNYNTCDYLFNLLASIKRHTRCSHRIIVVDNGSTDGCRERLEQESGLTLILNEKNKGYARACNQGILAGDSPYILLLNSDIEVNEGWLKPLLDTVRREDVAVVGPKMINKEGKIVGAGVTNLKKDTPRGWMVEDKDGVFDQEEEVISVGGACYLIKRDLLPVLGLFDEDYFFYYEELDYSLRAREKGYKVMYSPRSKIYHYHNKDREKKISQNITRQQYYYESKKRFREKWSDVIAGGEKRREPRKIILASVIPWNFRRQRPQHLVDSLLEEGYENLYLNPVCGGQKPQQIKEGLYLFSPTGYGTVLYNLKKGQEKQLGRQINKAIKKLNFENGIMLLNVPYWLPLLKYWEYSLLIYDCIDYYVGFEDLAREREWLLDKEEQLLKLADLVLTPSRRLFEDKKKTNRHTFYLPNAVNTDDFNLNYHPPHPPEDLPAYDKIVGYFGAIASWFDIELVAELAREIPEVGIVLIGEVSTDVSLLQNESNVYLLGEKPYRKLPDYLAFFDLAIIPFIENRLTRRTNPVKLYEYLAGGKRVLSTSLPEMEEFKEYIEIAGSKEEFINLARRMLQEEESPKRVQKRYDFIKNETWRKRASRLKELLHLAYYDLFETNGIGEEAYIYPEIKEENFSRKQDTMENQKKWWERFKKWFSGD